MKTQWEISKAGDARRKAADSNQQSAVCANDPQTSIPVLVLLLVWIWPAVVQAQFDYWIENDTITITRYTGPGGALTIPDTIDGLPVTGINWGAFRRCVTLTSVTIPDSVKNIGGAAFYECTSLTSIYCLGDAPLNLRGLDAFYATVYYMPGSMGWSAYYSGSPTALWDPRVVTSDGSLGVQTNGFGFNITASNDVMILVEACLDLADPTWVPLGTHTLTGGSFYFSDPQWGDHPTRFYRLRTP